MATDLELSILELAQRHLELMQRIVIALEVLSSAQPLKAPNYEMPLESWTGFNWESIGAIVQQTDDCGATVVSWRGQIFTRRSPSNRYDPAVWYSRCTGKDERGKNQYERLITFKPLAQAEPVPERVSRLVR